MIRAVNSIDFNQISDDLDAQAWAKVSNLLEPDSALELIELYGNSSLFRKQIDMSRHNFGRGKYQYFKYPLPKIIEQLRLCFYPPLAKLANQWSSFLDIDAEVPPRLAEYQSLCATFEQRLPTPLMLKYEAGDFNRMHQDIYGEAVFPIQMTILLSDPDEDFGGGEFLISEQRPRQQTRVEVVPLRRGDAVIFPSQFRPVKSLRGYSKANIRHGVSKVRFGTRFAAGIIFHDAK